MYEQLLYPQKHPVRIVIFVLGALLLPFSFFDLSIRDGAFTFAWSFDLIAFAALFIANLLVVLRVIEWPVALILTIAGVLLLRKPQLLKQADYALLLTFIGFFIFVGNLGRVELVSRFIASMLTGREVLVSALFSQVLSNVPAAILLSGFTDNFAALLQGVNIGGLGTIIASMASLISYKLYGAQPGADRTKYMLTFTLYNVAGLAILLAFALIL